VQSPLPIKRAGRNILTPTLKIKSLEKMAYGQQKKDGFSNNYPNKPFTVDDVKQLWRKYANSTENQSSLTLCSAMKKRDPRILSPTHFEFIIDNESQLTTIRLEEDNLVNFLRKNLENYDFKLTIRIEEVSQIEKPQKMLSGQDVFNNLARKFPDLHTLKQTFGLDIEY